MSRQLSQAHYTEPEDLTATNASKSTDNPKMAAVRVSHLIDSVAAHNSLEVAGSATAQRSR